MWFKKSKESNLSELPELPELPSLPESKINNSSLNLPPIQNTPEKKVHAVEISDNLPSLPSFTQSETANKISQEAIKSAISSEKTKQYAIEMPSSQREEEKFTPIIAKKYPVVENMENTAKSPVFIRIDKFKSALSNLKEIKKQINDIESYLEETKQIKLKEEQELAEWEKEVMDIKTKLDSVDKILFSKFE